MNIRTAKLPEELDLVIKQVELMMKELAERDEMTVGVGNVYKGLKDFEGSFFSFLAVDDDNNICGVLNLAESFAIYTNGSFGIITEFFVSHKNRHSGIGRQLLTYALEFVSDNGWSSLEVSVPLTPKGIHSVEFYEKLGFTHSGPKMKIDL